MHKTVTLTLIFRLRPRAVVCFALRARKVLPVASHLYVMMLRLMTTLRVRCLFSASFMVVDAWIARVLIDSVAAFRISFAVLPALLALRCFLDVASLVEDLRRWRRARR